jgi:hypothetical protein
MEEEVWSIIKELPADQAPGLDGFIGAFYKRAWPVIKPTIMAAVLKLFVGDRCNFGRPNRALITLIPKKPDVQEIGDYRPISLVHSFVKLFTKLLYSPEAQNGGVGNRESIGIHQRAEPAR